MDIRRLGVLCGLFLLEFYMLCSSAAAAGLLRCHQLKKDVPGYCLHQTIMVGKNSTLAQFHSIQDAILSLPNDNSTQIILVLPGHYVEQLNVTRVGPVTLLGQTSSLEDQSKNEVTVWWSSAKRKGSGLTDNAFTAVLTVAPNLNASLTGSSPTGFPIPADTPLGNANFRAYNINFRNNFSDSSAGPALAVSVSRANASFYFCGFYSYQDTVYVGKLGNAYFYGSKIAGQTDFLYGFGTAWIERSKLVLRGCKGGIIAWKGSETSFANKYGCYVSHSSIRAANSSIAPSLKAKCSLGRPWNALHKSVYQNTYMDETILPSGYTAWTNNSATNNFNSSTFMAEYLSHGPGWNLTARLTSNITRVLNETRVKPYKRPSDVFMASNGQQPDTSWVDTRYLYAEWRGN